MTAGNLRYTVVVRHPDNGEATALVAGQPVPDWATDLVHADDLEPKVAAKKAATSNKN